MLDCVLFDLDGLLVDSEPLQFRAYQYAFTQFGITLTMDDWIRWHSNEASTARWVESEELDIDVQQLRTVKKSRYDEMIANELKAKPGAVALVESCASSLKLALVSASRRESIEACLGKFGILHHFSVLVSGSEVARSKPWPDPYLAAMQALDTTPNHAIALEDSLTGYRAARAAGLGCVVCPDHFIPKLADAFDGAALVTDSLASLSIDILHGIHSASDTPDN
jgi:putative hydrolase of the HAD superfamily